MSKIYILLIFNLFTFIQCVEIKKQIYYEIPNESVSHCVRRLNLTSAVGCSSKYDGNVGLIEIAFSESELNLKLKNLTTDTILVIDSNLFVKPNIVDRILNSSFISGLIVFEARCNESSSEETCPKNFSEDYKIPNELYSISYNHSFNEFGSHYGFKNWPFPVSLIGKRHIQEQNKIISCYKKFNVNSTSHRRCALEIKNFMAAVKSAKTCFEYQNIQNKFASMFHPIQFCQDFTGRNYVVHVNESVTYRPPKSVIALISRIDSLSMFEKSASSVNGAVTSSALLLSVMHLLMSQPEFKVPKNLKKDVIFLFLDNEAYDYLGSNRFILDLREGNVAKESGVSINGSHFDLLLEFGELGLSNFEQASFFYPKNFDKMSDKNKTLRYLADLSHYFEVQGFNGSSFNHDLDLPPASVQYFLRSGMIPAIVMTDHNDQFKNPFYNSFLDDKPRSNNSEVLVAIVNAVASFVYQEATGKNLTQFLNSSDLATPSKIVDCFTKNIRCDLLKEVLTTKVVENLNSLGTPIPTQAHSASSEVSSDYRYSFLLSNLIVHMSGEKINNSACSSCPTCTNMTSIKFGNDIEQCYRIRVLVSEEFSFDNAKQSLWVSSSIVDKQSIRMFVQASNTPLLVTGIVLTLLMTILMTLVSSRMSEIFQCDS